ncbi:hypothetical protein [Streptomyces sp. NPDC046859]|uniref:hypothetical protein n=1 Tax=Streptomyces sp. NPDC046859 TaxID=3155734 RepID=UPI0034099FE3
MTVGLTLGIGAALMGAAVALWAQPSVLPVALAGTQLMSGVAGGLTVSPNQTQVLQHAPAEAAGVGGGILQMAQRIATAVCLSAVPAVYLHAASGPPGGSHARAGYALASCVCAGLLAVALLLSLLHRAGTPPRPSVPASAAHAGAVSVLKGDDVTARTGSARLQREHGPHKKVSLQDSQAERLALTIF